MSSLVHSIIDKVKGSSGSGSVSGVNLDDVTQEHKRDIAEKLKHQAEKADHLSRQQLKSHECGGLQINPEHLVDDKIAHRKVGAGTIRLTLHEQAGRDFLITIPPHTAADLPLPLCVFFHGAGGDADQAKIMTSTKSHKFVTLSPASSSSTWDMIASRKVGPRSFGPDVVLLDVALENVFKFHSTCSDDDPLLVDRRPSRLALAGFSDGASYALSLVFPNLRLFHTLLAFSPGFYVGDAISSASPDSSSSDAPRIPHIYISHGTGDRVLNIDRCSRRLVPMLRAAGCDVQYDEFQGPHTVPPHCVNTAVEQWLHKSASEHKE